MKIGILTKDGKMYWMDLSWGQKSTRSGGYVYGVPYLEERKFTGPLFSGNDNRVELDPKECRFIQITEGQPLICPVCNGILYYDETSDIFACSCDIDVICENKQLMLERQWLGKRVSWNIVTPQGIIFDTGIVEAIIDEVAARIKIIPDGSKIQAERAEILIERLSELKEKP